MTVTCAHDLKGKFRTNSIYIRRSLREEIQSRGQVPFSPPALHQAFRQPPRHADR